MDILSQPCKVDGCKTKNETYLYNGYVKRRFTNGYCRKHYSRLKRGYDLTAPTIYERRPSIIEGITAKIPLGLNAKHGYAIVDKEFATLDKYNWTRSSTGYPVTCIDGINTKIYHMIMGKAPHGYVTDHVNRNRLDNRKNNLRFTSAQLNSMNRTTQSNNKSGYKGVIKDGSRWRASYKGKSIGNFKTPIEAAKAYDAYVASMFGDIAYLNFPKA